MSRTVSLRAAALSLALGLSSLSACAETLRMLSSWDNTFPLYKAVVEPFMKKVEVESQGRLKIALSGPEAVSPLEQFQPVQAGAFQLLYTHGAYHFGTTPLLVAYEALGGNLESRRAAGLVSFIDERYQKLGLKLIALPTTQDGGYQFILRQPIGPSGDMQGRKIRATPTYVGVLSLMNASSVVIPPSDTYSSLEKGVIDGAAWTTIGVVPYRFDEVAKYLVRPTFGLASHPIFMNLQAYNKLADADKKALLDAGRQIEQDWYKRSAELAAEEEKDLKGKGMSVTMMGAAQQGKLKASWSEGIIKSVTAKPNKDVEDLLKLAKDKGLL